MFQIAARSTSPYSFESSGAAAAEFQTLGPIETDRCNAPDEAAMWQMISTFHLEEWLEYVGLLAAVSGFLLILSGHLAIAIRRLARGPAVSEPADGGDLPSLDSELLLWTAMKQRGEFHLAVGGGVFALAKMVDLWTNPGGLF